MFACSPMWTSEHEETLLNHLINLLKLLKVAE